jgi:hypothetical protein
VSDLIGFLILIPLVIIAWTFAISFLLMVIALFIEIFGSKK